MLVAHILIHLILTGPDKAFAIISLTDKEMRMGGADCLSQTSPANGSRAVI